MVQSAKGTAFQNLEWFCYFRPRAGKSNVLTWGALGGIGGWLPGEGAEEGQYFHTWAFQTGTPEGWDALGELCVCVCARIWKTENERKDCFQRLPAQLQTGPGAPGGFTGAIFLITGDLERGCEDRPGL